VRNVENVYKNEKLLLICNLVQLSIYPTIEVNYSLPFCSPDSLCS